MKRALALTLCFLAPGIALAAPSDLKGLADFAVQILSDGTLLLIGIGFMLFIWGIAKNLLEVGEGGHGAMEVFRENIGWGLLALFVMVSFWGLLQILQNTIFPS